MRTTDDLLPFKGDTSACLATEVKSVAKLVHKITHIPWQQILGRRRPPRVADARMLLWSIMYARGYSYSRLGKVSKRNHATIMHSVKAVRERYGVRGYNRITDWIDELEKQPGITVVVRN